MKKILLLYIPVIHEGYIKIFKKYADEVECLYIMGKNLSMDFAFFEKEIRAVDPETIKIMIESLCLFKSVCVLDYDNLQELKGSQIITAREGVIKRLVEKHLADEDVLYDTVFLRWDEEYVSKRVEVIHNRISEDSFDQEMMDLASKEGEATSCWWRRVGAVVVNNNGDVAFEGHNSHLPSEHTPYVLGDPRDFVEPGTHPDFSSSLHAEKGIIAQAARTVLEGSSIYLSVFPCADCARMIVEAGFKKCFFHGGQSYFDGEQTLRSGNVEIIFVP